MVEANAKIGHLEKLEPLEEIVVKVPVPKNHGEFGRGGWTGHRALAAYKEIIEPLPQRKVNESIITEYSQGGEAEKKMIHLIYHLLPSRTVKSTNYLVYRFGEELYLFRPQRIDLYPDAALKSEVIKLAKENQVRLNKLSPRMTNLRPTYLVRQVVETSLDDKKESFTCRIIVEKIGLAKTVLLHYCQDKTYSSYW